MAWMSVADRRGRGWEVDLDIVSQILYSEAFARKKRRRARTVHESHGIYPDTWRVVVDYSGMREAVRASAQRQYRRFVDDLFRDGAEAQQSLIDARRRAIRDVIHVRRMQRNTSRDTTRSVARAERNARAGLATAQFVRDRSADFIIIGASMMTGGAGLAWLAAGSALQGTGTYQDTGNVGAAILQTTTSFAFGAIPITQNVMVGNAQLRVGERCAMFFVAVMGDTASDSLVSLATGEDARPAIVSAMVNASMGNVASELGEPFFDSLTVPTRAVAETVTSAVAGADSSGGGGSAAQRQRIRPMRRHLSPGCALIRGVRDFNAQHNEDYVQLYALRSVREGLRPPSREQLLGAFQGMHS